VRTFPRIKNPSTKPKPSSKGIAIDPESVKNLKALSPESSPMGRVRKNLGGAKEGMVHVSQMHTSRIGHPEDMVKLGDIVHVKSLGMDKGKLSLT
jgi:polyribonucleotide nucleotidyltransferase